MAEAQAEATGPTITTTMVEEEEETIGEAPGLGTDLMQPLPDPTRKSGSILMLKKPLPKLAQFRPQQRPN